MTPKEKAVYLIQSFRIDIHSACVTMEYNDAKQCALIAVDFHLKEFEDWATSVMCAEDFSYKYWQEVKEEINKL